MQWRAVSGLKTAVVILLGVCAVGALGLGVAVVHRLHVIDKIGRGSATFGEAQHADDQVRTFGVLLIVLGLATGVTWIVWQWRVAKNVQGFGTGSLSFAPGWSIGAWFIPCASIILPVLVVQDIWRASQAQVPYGGKRKASTLVTVWWVFTMLGSLGTRLLQGSRDTSSLDSLRSADRWLVVSALVVVASAVLAILVVQQVTDRVEVLRTMPRPAPPVPDPSMMPSWQPPPHPGWQPPQQSGWAPPPAAGAPPPPPATVGVLPMSPADWYPDPVGRFEHRYWDGSRWTEHVSTAGAAGVDPIDPTLAFNLPAPRR